MTLSDSKTSFRPALLSKLPEFPWRHSPSTASSNWWKRSLLAQRCLKAPVSNIQSTCCRQGLPLLLHQRSLLPFLPDLLEVQKVFGYSFVVPVSNCNDMPCDLFVHKHSKWFSFSESFCHLCWNLFVSSAVLFLNFFTFPLNLFWSANSTTLAGYSA